VEPWIVRSAVSRIRRAVVARAAVARVLAALGGLTLVTSGCKLRAEGGPEPVSSTSEAVTICAQGDVIEGVDVSHHNGTIDWVAAHAAGIAFTIAKASEADTFVDPMFTTNRQDAKAAGVAFGAYHFFRADVDPTVQANHFLDVIGSVEPARSRPRSI